MELKESTHPVKIFDDPRWADMLRKVNARRRDFPEPDQTRSRRHDNRYN